MRRVLLLGVVCLGMLVGGAGSALAGGPHGGHGHHGHGYGHGHGHGHGYGGYPGGVGFYSYYRPYYRPMVVAPPVYPYPYACAPAYPAYPAYAAPSLGFGVGGRNFSFFYNQ